MTALFRRYATPFVTGLFLVSLISGIALFFHVGPGAFHGIHEWLSMVLILPFLMHLWRNWRGFANYFRHVPMALALGVSIAASLAFFVPTGGQAARGGPPQFAFAERVLDNGTVEDVAPLVGLTADEAKARLAAAGFEIPAPDATLSAIAAASNKSSTDLLRLLQASSG